MAFYFFMRLDIFLKLTRLILRRTLAKEFAKAGLIKVNDVTAKASYEVKLNDVIEIRKHNQITKVRTVEIPKKKQVSKQHARKLYNIISEEIIEEEIW